MKRRIESLALLENECLNAYILNQNNEEGNKVESKLEKMEEKISKVLQRLDSTEKKEDALNDWGKAFPAGKKLYEINDCDCEVDDEFKPDRVKTQKHVKETSPTHVVSEELEKMKHEEEVVEENQMRNLENGTQSVVPNEDKDIAKRLSKIESKIAAIEEKSDETLNKVDELILSLHQIITNVN